MLFSSTHSSLVSSLVNLSLVNPSSLVYPCLVKFLLSKFLGDLKLSPKIWQASPAYYLNPDDAVGPGGGGSDGGQLKPPHPPGPSLGQLQQGQQPGQISSSPGPLRPPCKPTVCLLDVLGVKTAAVGASASAAALQGPVMDLGQEALDKYKLAGNFPQMFLFSLPWLVTVLQRWKETGFLLFSRSFKMFMFQARLSLRMSILWLSGRIYLTFAHAGCTYPGLFKLCAIGCPVSRSRTYSLPEESNTVGIRTVRKTLRWEKTVTDLAQEGVQLQRVVR